MNVLTLEALSFPVKQSMRKVVPNVPKVVAVVTRLTFEFEFLEAGVFAVGTSTVNRHHCCHAGRAIENRCSNDPPLGVGVFELSLLDEANQLGIRHCVRQAHTKWSEIDG